MPNAGTCQYAAARSHKLRRLMRREAMSWRTATWRLLMRFSGSDAESKTSTSRALPSPRQRKVPHAHLWCQSSLQARQGARAQVPVLPPRGAAGEKDPTITNCRVMNREQSPRAGHREATDDGRQPTAD